MEGSMEGSLLIIVKASLIFRRNHEGYTVFTKRNHEGCAVGEL
jgi:hypothetical protein